MQGSSKTMNKARICNLEGYNTDDAQSPWKHTKFFDIMIDKIDLLVNIFSAILLPFGIVKGKKSFSNPPITEEFQDTWTSVKMVD